MIGIARKCRDKVTGAVYFAVEFVGTLYPIDLRDQSVRNLREGQEVELATDVGEVEVKLGRPEQVRGVREKV